MGTKMDKSETSPEEPAQPHVCEECGSQDVKYLETEYMMGKEIKRYICERCETKFYISEE